MGDSEMLARSPLNLDPVAAASPKSSVRQQSILLIGAGKRIESTVLPALACLQDEYKIAGIYSRSQDKLDRLGTRWQVPVSTELDAFDWDAINVIYIAVTLHNVPDVLQAITTKPTSQIVLMLDTPVLAKGHLDFTRLFRRFQAVYVGEDCIALPQFEVVRQTIASGAIGRPQKMWMFHSGYLYHAIATVRSLVGCSRVLLGRSRNYGRGGGEIQLKFASGFEVTIVQPRDYGVGRFLLVGSEGTIADYPLQAENARVIEYLQEGDRWTGLAVNGEAWPKTDLDRRFDTLSLTDLPDRSLMTQLKIRGLVSVLAYLQTGLFDRVYPATEGIYDSMLCYAMDVLPTWVDGLLLGGGTGINVFFLGILPVLLAARRQLGYKP
ncbi:MAG: hypothetical protein AAFY15_02270 [Cyanobacteria bacterium J06648_11]